jgi:hypothetical protein
LNANKSDTSELAVTPKMGNQRRDIHASVRLVDNLYIDGDIRSQHLPFGAIGCYTVNRG